MSSILSLNANATDAEHVKPLAAEIDVHGLTHRGLVRAVNADHFLVASFRRAMEVHASSLPPESFPPFSADTRGFVFLVADGVGAMPNAKEGSAQAADAVARYLVDMGEVSMQADPERETEVTERLGALVARAHQRLMDFAEEAGGTAATTLTMV